MKILVAEDDELILNMLEFRLRKDGHEVITAGDGRIALQNIEDFAPELVISDIMMPFVSGLELVAAIKEKYHSKTKIILLTTMGQEDVVIQAFKLGVDDFMTKPFSPNELTLRVKRFEIHHGQ